MSDQNGHLDDAQEQAEESSTTDGPAAAGEYDPAQGSPDSGEHPVGESYPDEATQYADGESHRSEQADQ
jgi:hypothetical protein